MADENIRRYIFKITIIILGLGVFQSRGWLRRFLPTRKPVARTTARPYNQTGPYPDSNFTDGLRGWKNGKKLHWGLAKSISKNVGMLTGVQGAGDGFVIVQYTEYVFFKGKVAKLYSNFITGPVCMKFYFYLYGQNTGYIQILTKQRNSTNEKLVLKKYGNHGHKWNFAQVYLDFLGTDVYQIIIFGAVANFKVQASFAIDDISFKNETCVSTPEDKNFNCSFDAGTCGWKLKGTTRIKYNTELKQYVNVFDANQRVNLQSPTITAHKGCLTLQYYVFDRSSSLDKSRMFVYVKDAKSKQLLPVNDELVYYGHSNWKTFKIELNISSGFTQMVIDFILVQNEVFIANFFLGTDFKYCKSDDVEKIFFVSTRKTFPKEYEISKDGRLCNVYPTSRFTAHITPTNKYPLPFFIYLSSHHMALSEKTDNSLGYLVGYFYVSMTRHSDASAIYYKVDKDKYGDYISEFSSSLPERNWTGKVVYVKNHEHFTDNGHCPPGYLGIAKKCLWFICEADYPRGAEARCLQDFSYLASLHSNTMHLVGEYLNRIQIKRIEILHVTIGLSRKDGKWMWTDGKIYNDSDGLLGNHSEFALLAWNSNRNEWELMGVRNNLAYVSLHLCEKHSKNRAYNSDSHQSTTYSHFQSQFAVDGFLHTCSLTQFPAKRSQYSWWEVKFLQTTKVYMVQVKYPPSQHQNMKASLLLSLKNQDFNTHVKKINMDTAETPVIYEPPLSSRRVRIMSQDQQVKLCDVQIYGADSYEDIQGVMRTFWRKPLGTKNILEILPKDKSYPNHPLFFNLASSFLYTKTYPRYIREFRAYFLASKSGNYTFSLAGNVEAEMSVTMSRYSTESFMTLLLEKEKSSYYRFLTRRISSSLVLKACQFYFVKLITTYSEEFNNLVIGIEQDGRPHQSLIDTNRLFWVLPGRLEVRFHLRKSETTTSAQITHPINITGFYDVECVGSYCGDCPVAVFLSFGGNIKCVTTSSPSISQEGYVSLHLKNKFMLPGAKPIYMGYKVNGDCRMISLTPESNSSYLDNVEKVGTVRLNPMILTSCLLKSAKLCEAKSIVNFHGWMQKVETGNKNGKIYLISSMENVTSSFSYKWIKYHKFLDRTGICFSFQYKITGDNNTLSMYFATLSGKKTLVWKIHGNHGNVWKYGEITYWPSENLSFIFEGQVIQPDTMVAIANILVKTESCNVKVQPLYADPEYICSPKKFECGNGQCIKKGYQCDGDRYCADGSDELFCECLAEQVKCEESARCVDARKLCNGLKDCDDGSDERNCDGSCEHGQFYCPSGLCIPWSLTCDGIWDCPDGADEPHVCYGTTEFNRKRCPLNDLSCFEESANLTFCEKFAEGSCDFERSGLCNWEQVLDGGDNFDWSINSGSTPSKFTGSNVDHTTGSIEGSYIYIEASEPRVKDDKALLKAGPFQSNINFCFTFHYHMYGIDIGSLNIYKSLNGTEKFLMWTRNKPANDMWETGWFDIQSGERFYLLIEGVCGDGALGDIAVDDISMVQKNCSQVHEDISPFCSFEENCIWETVGDWKRKRVQDRNRLMPQGYFLKTITSGKIWATLPNEMTEKYQCMSFWYAFSYCPEMSFTSAQEHDENILRMRHYLSDKDENHWLFTEMPLDRCEKKSKITFDIVIPCAQSYFGIDEIQFSIEPCLTFQQGGSAWMRKSGKLFKTSKKQNSDGSITAFYNSRLSSSLNHISPTRTPSFIDAISPDLVNYIVSNAKPSNHSEISVGTRVFIENNPDTASLGTVIVKDETPSKYKLTARLDCNGSDIEVLKRKVYLLPYQLDKHGPKWRTTNRCQEQYKSSCVFFTNSLNWFDAADYCKARGAELGKIYSEDEEKIYKSLHSKKLPFWVGYHGHKHQGKKFVWNDDSEDVFNKLSNKSLKNRLSAGLCSLVTKDPLWQRTNCSEAHSVLCTQPGRQLKILNYCDREDVQKLSCEISKTVLLIKKAELSAATDGMCSTSVIKNKNCSQLYISSKHHLLAETKAMCEGRSECNISVKSITNDPCPLERKRINIEYKCLVQSRGYPVLAERNSAFHPREWKKFRASYYKADARKTIWKEARAICEMERGATLVSIEDKQEENYVMNLMSSIGLNVSHIGLTAKEYPGNFEWLDGSKSSYRNWENDTVKSFAGELFFVAVGSNGWFQSVGNYGFVCKYTPGVGGCDFETGWCGWKDTSAESCCRWSRSKGIDDTSSKSTLSGVYKTEQTTDVYIYQFLNEERKDIFFKVDRPKEMNRLTLCLWVYVDSKSISGATIVLFGKKLGVKIYYEKDLKFVVGFYDWNTTTNATVSIDSWQHICFLIDTIENLWSFYKDGGLTNIALSRVSKFSSDARDTDDNQVFLGEETKCSFECSNFKHFFGKMTKPVMWSKIIDAHEILALSSGCGIFREAGDMEIYKDSELDMRAKLVDHGECTAGKGFRLQCRKISNASTVTFPSASTLVSPWMRSSLDSVRGICMNFTYRILGLDSQIDVWIEPRNTVKERLWSVKSSRKHDLWKNGQLSLGLVSKFRVHVTATLWSNLSEVNVDNIFFTEGYCSPVPKNAQEWHTHVANSSSGYLASPYYPSVYLNNMKRSWKIEVPQDQRINLNVLFMNLEDAKHCSRDSIVFKDTFLSRKYTSYCGNTFPVGYLSTRNVVYVTFQSDESQVRTGFKIHYQAISIDKDSCRKNDIIDCPPTLRCHPFSLNKSKIYVYAENLLRIPDYFPEKTTAINFDGNALVTLTTFVNLTSLEFLSISGNKIISIDKKTFHNLTSLRTLRLPSNFLKDIPRNVFRRVKSLEMLDLSMNRLYKLDKTLFLDLNYLRLLSLRKNRIRFLEDGVFSNLRKLQYLYLDDNDLSNLGSKVFDANSVLRTLILKNNKLKKVKKSWLKGKLSLVTLKLQNNEIKEIEAGSFDDLKNLVDLDISNNQIHKIPQDLFQNLLSLRHLKVDHFTLCCFAKQNNPSVSCVAKFEGGFSSCDELLKNDVLKYSIWILGLMAFLGNFIVIVWRSFSKDSNHVASFLLTNLAVADFLMGVYLLIISYKDTVWNGVYFKHDISWRASNLCIFAGVISTLSSEVSVLTLTVITLERMICIIFTLKFQRWSMKKAWGIMIVVWLIGLCISIIPLLNDAYFYDYKQNAHFFGRSPVCLPLQLSSDRPAGWEYSVFVFLVLNGVSFLFILLAYVFMYRSIVNAARSVRSTRVKKDSTIAKRMMFIILTDFLCWFPVIILSILALTGNLYDPSKQVYAWVAVFVLPINSSINPLLYTFSTPYVRKMIPTSNRLSRLPINYSIKGRFQKGQPKGILADESPVRGLDTGQTAVSSFSTPQAVCRTHLGNVEQLNKKNVGESSFIHDYVEQ